MPLQACKFKPFVLHSRVQGEGLAIAEQWVRFYTMSVMSEVLKLLMISELLHGIQGSLLFSKKVIWPSPVLFETGLFMSVQLQIWFNGMVSNLKKSAELQHGIAFARFVGNFMLLPGNLGGSAKAQF